MSMFIAILIIFTLLIVVGFLLAVLALTQFVESTPELEDSDFKDETACKEDTINI